MTDAQSGNRGGQDVSQWDTQVSTGTVGVAPPGNLKFQPLNSISTSSRNSRRRDLPGLLRKQSRASGIAEILLETGSICSTVLYIARLFQASLRFPCCVAAGGGGLSSLLRVNKPPSGGSASAGGLPVVVRVVGAPSSDESSSPLPEPAMSPAERSSSDESSS